jgi:predicted transposase YdaD
MKYDIAIKYLIEQFPKQFVQFIIGRECKVDMLTDKELLTIKRETDKLLLITESDGEKYILHIEAQSTYEEMIGRMIEYAGLIFK